MTRTLPSGASDREDVTVVYLLEVIFWNGSSEVATRLTTAKDDITVDADGDSSAETYTAAGQFLAWSGQRETTDVRGQGVRIELSGVDQSIISTILQNDFRGRRVRIWRAKLDPSTGTVDETYLVHRGQQLEDYEVTEEHDPDGAVTAKVATRSVSPLAASQQTNEVKTNQRSHHAMLERAGISGPTDTGLAYVKQLPGRVFWGQEAPDPALTGENDGASAGTSDGPTTGPWSPMGP